MKSIFALLFFASVAWAAPVPDTVPPISSLVHTDATSPIALTTSGLNPADRLLVSAKDVIPLSGSGATGDMLQFKAGGHVLGFQPNKAFLAGLDHALSIEFIGTPGVTPTSASTAPATGNLTKAPALSAVRYQNLWDNISLTYESTKDGITESTYNVAPGGDVSKIRLRYNVPVELQADGSLKIKFDTGDLIESSPVAWQEIGEKHVPVTVAFRVSGNEVGFNVGQYDRSHPLIIDPTYIWHSLYGGSGFNAPAGIAVDASGNVYVTGNSSATWGSPIHDYSNSGGSDYNLFVLKINSSGAYQWHTFYGSNDKGTPCTGIAVDGSGNVYVTGWSTGTWGSPLNAYSYSGDTYGNVFVLKLNSSGAYQWHTFYGPNNYGYAITIDGNDNVYVTGESSNTWGFPLNAHSDGICDIFVLKLNSSGAYQWHTFHGTSYDSRGFGIAVDGNDDVYVTGDSFHTWNGPTGQSPLHAYSGGYFDVFVLKLNSSGAYQWHTFYGSSDYGYGMGVNGYAIALDRSGNVYITGYSDETWNGPTGQCPLNAHGGRGNTEIFVLKLNSSGAYQWHTFYGSNGQDYGIGIAVDSNGNINVTGNSDETWASPTGRSPINAHSEHGNPDTFVLKLSSSGAYQWHTFHGSGGEYEGGSGIAVDGSCSISVTGYLVGKVFVLKMSEFGISGLSSPALMPDTGQTECYDVAGKVITCPSPGQALYGQDASYSINPMSYTKLDGRGNAMSDSATSWVMVRDNVTGLIWENKTDDGTIHDKDNTYTWFDPTDPNPGTPGDGTDTKDFIDALNSAHFGGYSDWRLPTIKELGSIANHDIPYPGPAINTNYFPNTQSSALLSFYWSSTTYAIDTNSAFGAPFMFFIDSHYDKSNSGYVRAVRGGKIGPIAAGSYTNNGDGTLTDSFTGLMWQQGGSSNTMTWQQALAYATTSSGGYSDWRLPTIKELRSLVDFNSKRSIDPYFSAEFSSFYWSSTTLSSPLSNYADSLFFSGGADGFSEKGSASGYVRAVRGGQTCSLDHLIILSPKQADNWTIDSQKVITWNTQSIAGDVKISISRDGGKTYASIADSTPNDGSYSWTVTGLTSVNCMMKIEPVSDVTKGTVQGLFTLFQQTSSQTGSLTVIISPQDAIAAGAEWRVDGSKWQASGATVPGLVIGEHTVDFKSVTGWTTPSNRTVSISDGQAVNITGTYALIGDINGDGNLDLSDAILCLQVITGMLPDNINPAADVNDDGKIGIAEAIYAIQKVAGLQ